MIEIVAVNAWRSIVRLHFAPDERYCRSDIHRHFPLKTGAMEDRSGSLALHGASPIHNILRARHPCLQGTRLLTAVPRP